MTTTAVEMTIPTVGTTASLAHRSHGAIEDMLPMSNNDIDKHISDLRLAVEETLSRHEHDPRAVLLMRALLSQVSTVQAHCELMSAEAENRFRLSEQEFNEIMEPYLRLNKAIRKTVTRAPNSLYETEPINGVYELLSHHFQEEGER